MSNISVGVLSRNFGALALFVPTLGVTAFADGTEAPITAPSVQRRVTQGVSVKVENAHLRTRGNQKSDPRSSDPSTRDPLLGLGQYVAVAGLRPCCASLAS
jgi:hypothetical protein